MEKVDPKDGAALRGVAGKLLESYCPQSISVPPAIGSMPAASPAPVKVRTELPIVVNAPLDFELKGSDATHPYPLGRGLTSETIQRFGFGYCSRGLLRGWQRQTQQRS